MWMGVAAQPLLLVFAWAHAHQRKEEEKGRKLN